MFRSLGLLLLLVSGQALPDSWSGVFHTHEKNLFATAVASTNDFYERNAQLLMIANPHKQCQLQFVYSADYGTSFLLDSVDIRIDDGFVYEDVLSRYYSGGAKADGNWRSSTELIFTDALLAEVFTGANFYIRLHTRDGTFGTMEFPLEGISGNAHELQGQCSRYYADSLASVWG